MKKHILMLSAMVFGVTGFSFITRTDPWVVPDKYNKMPNPVKSDAASIAAGKEVWTKHCQSCHGKSGKGDGPKAAQLKTLPPDLSQADAQRQTDGAMFYKTIEGRDDMPSFKKKIPDQEDLWSVINYIRTFKK